MEEEKDAEVNIYNVTIWRGKDGGGRMHLAGIDRR